jgi:hypothetical protein
MHMEAPAKRVARAVCNSFVGQAWFCAAARMVMCQDDGSGVVPQDLFDDFPRVDGRPIDSAQWSMLRLARIYSKTDLLAARCLRPTIRILRESGSFRLSLGVASAPWRFRDRVLSVTVLHMGRSAVHPIL